MERSLVSHRHIPILPQRLLDLQSQLAFINDSIATRTISTDLHRLKLALEGLRLEVDSELQSFLHAVAAHYIWQSNVSSTSLATWMNRILHYRQNTLSLFGNQSIDDPEGDSFMDPWNPPHPYRDPIHRTFDQIMAPQSRNIPVEANPSLSRNIDLGPVSTQFTTLGYEFPSENGSIPVESCSEPEPPAYLSAGSFEDYIAQNPDCMRFWMRSDSPCISMRSTTSSTHYIYRANRSISECQKTLFFETPKVDLLFGEASLESMELSSQSSTSALDATCRPKRYKRNIFEVLSDHGEHSTFVQQVLIFLY